MKVEVQQVITLLIIISIAAPLLYPIGLPIVIDKKTVIAYEIINSLKPGSLVAINCQFSAAQYADQAPALIAILNHISRLEDVNFIYMGLYNADAAMLSNKVFEAAGIPKSNMEYGVDYVNLGYAAGAETAVVGVANDAHGVFPTDYYGNPIAELPLMERFHKITDADSIIFLAERIDFGVRQWQVLGVPIIGVALTMEVPVWMPYYVSGQLVGYIPGLSGGATYEALIKSPGLGTSALDAMSLAHFVVIFFLIYGNVIYVRERRKKI